MDGMNVTSEVLEHEGQKTLRIDAAGKGVSIALPTDAKTIEAACKVLMMNLAGVSEAELFIAGSTALIEAGELD
jgi:hypothetical protein